MVKKSSSVPERWRLEPGFVPRRRYTEPAFLELEYERLFPHVWQMACRLEEIPQSGDYLEYEIGDQSILVVNRGEGGLRAYFNSCPHRGTRLLRGRGNVQEIRCRFHAWCFDLDGRCTYVHGLEDFGEDFAIDRIRLTECRIDTWGGWVFVNMDPEAPPLLEWLDPLPRSLDPFCLERMRYRYYKATVMPANWKTVVDAFVEGYHVGGSHPQNLRKTRIDHGPASREELARAPYTPSFSFRNHSRFLYGVRPTQEASAASMGDPDDVERLIVFTEYNALSLKALANERDVRTAHQLRERPVPAGMTAFQFFQELRREAAEAEGIAWPKLSAEEYVAGQGNWHVFPNMVGLFEPGCALGYRVRPNGKDPDSCIFEVWTLELYPEGGEPGAQREFYEDWRDHDGWGLLLPQDFGNLPEITAGLHSRGFRGLRLNPKQESAIYNAHVVADRFLFGG
jgi:phenylpropionate dioxygenase-like ring-hydroxylating dioxygenase large terminal subunit